MVIAVVAACAVLAAGVLTVLAVHRSRRESERRLEIVFERVSSHLEAISTSVEQAVARMVDAQRERSQPLSLDFDALVDALVAEAAVRTGADAVVLRVEGPGGRLVLASLGAGAESELAERAFAPPGARPFRAATIDWTYSASGEADDEGFRSALVAPLAPSTGIPGTLVAYSSTSHAFRRSTRRRCTGWLPSSAPAWRTRAASRTSKPGCFTIPRPVLPAAVATRWSSAGKSLGRTGPGARCRSCWSGSTAPRQRRRPAATRASTRSPDFSSESRERATSRADVATASSRS